MAKLIVPPTAVFSLTWDHVGKRWRLSWTVRLSDRANASHWLWVDTDVDVDALGANEIARAIARAMYARMY